jgi:hypothetical protein
MCVDLASSREEINVNMMKLLPPHQTFGFFSFLIWFFSLLFSGFFSFFPFFTLKSFYYIFY